MRAKKLLWLGIGGFAAYYFWSKYVKPAASNVQQAITSQNANLATTQNVTTATTAPLSGFY